MNSYDTSESGRSPYDLTFGTVTNRRFDFAKGSLDSEQINKYVKMLNDSLKTLSATAARYQADLVQKHTAVNQLQNVYQKGDLVFGSNQTQTAQPAPYLPSSLEVLEQVKNDVQVRHIAMHTISTLFVGCLKVFYGSCSDARNLAAVDADQFLVPESVPTAATRCNAPPCTSTLSTLIRIHSGCRGPTTYRIPKRTIRSVRSDRSYAHC